MELKEYIKMEIEGLARNEERVIKGLTQKEIEWQPACGCNSIGLMLFHAFKAEDSFMNEDKTQMLWEKGKWYTKMGLDAKEDGAHFKDAEAVNAFSVEGQDGVIVAWVEFECQCFYKGSRAGVVWISLKFVACYKTGSFFFVADECVAAASDRLQVVRGEMQVGRRNSREDVRRHYLQVFESF